MKINSQANTNAWAKAGIMVRNDITGTNTSPGFLILVEAPGKGYVIQWDNNGDGQLDSNSAPNNTGIGTATYPSWLKLVRTGTTYTGYYSTDGTTWTEVGQRERRRRPRPPRTSASSPPPTSRAPPARSTSTTSAPADLPDQRVAVPRREYSGGARAVGCSFPCGRFCPCGPLANARRGEHHGGCSTAPPCNAGSWYHSPT